MNKRGQVTLFIILSIVVIVVIGFVFFQRNIKIKTTGDIETDERFVSAQIEPIKSYVEDCIKNSAFKGLTLIGKQGGYFKPGKALRLGNLNVSYACYKVNNEYVNTLPLISDMDEQFNLYMEDKDTQIEIDECIDNFNNFRPRGLTIESGDLNVNGNIKPDKVLVNINYPLRITKGDYTATVSAMDVEILAGLGKAYSVATDIVNKECNNEDFDFDSLGKNEPIVTSSIQSYGNNLIIYLDTIAEDKEIPISFNFVIEQ